MKKAFPALLALLCACLALLVATSSSPLYATNFWTDTNIYFTIGRGMTRGLMPYRDLFDHKGPLLFILYALGAAISDTSFIGVFALEALSLAAAVYAGWRTVRLFGGGRLTLLAMPLLAAATCCCTAFTQGGSAGGICAACAGRWRLFDAGGDDAGGGKDARAHAGLRRGGGLGVPDQIHGHRPVCRAGRVPAGVCLAAGGVRPRAACGGADAAGRGAGLRARGSVSGGQRCAGRVRRGLFRAEPV